MRYTTTIIAFCFPLLAFAADEEDPDFSRFEKKTNIEVSGITTPKVVRYQTSEYHGAKTVLLNEDGDIISHRWITKYEKVKKQSLTVKEVSSTFEGIQESLVDGNRNTKFTFHPTQKGDKKVKLVFPQKTEISGIFVAMDDGIIPPKKLSVFADFGDGEYLPVLDKIKFRWHLDFPAISVNGLEIAYATPHFFRINEIRILGQEESTQKDEIIFFAEEGKKYTLYSGAHFGIKDKFIPEKKQPLVSDEETPVFPLVHSLQNPKFNPDYDEDGVHDVNDLCPRVKDTANKDVDNNGRGDVCEDPDLDKIYSHEDNCPFAHNPDQKDSDKDGEGDDCDKEEGRFTENMDFLLWVVFGIGAGVLGWLVMRSGRK